MAAKYVYCTTANPDDPQPRHPRHVAAGDPQPAAIDDRQRPGQHHEGQRHPQLAQVRGRDPVVEQEPRQRAVEGEHRRGEGRERVAQPGAAVGVRHGRGIVAAILAAPGRSSVW
jgi:hypothetical protein